MGKVLHRLLHVALEFPEQPLEGVVLHNAFDVGRTFAAMPPEMLGRRVAQLPYPANHVNANLEVALELIDPIDHVGRPIIVVPMRPDGYDLVATRHHLHSRDRCGQEALGSEPRLLKGHPHIRRLFVGRLPL